MSTVNNGPQIVRTGLILDLDAGYMRSYSPNVFPNPIDPYAWAVNGGAFQMKPIGGLALRLPSSAMSCLMASKT